MARVERQRVSSRRSWAEQLRRYGRRRRRYRRFSRTSTLFLLTVPGSRRPSMSTDLSVRGCNPPCSQPS
eukprot:8605860-Lingulodinium_polyedra.AAC.1